MQANGEVLDELRSNFHGELIEPEHAEYEAARRVWNADIDRRPAAIARCESVDDVRTAVLAAMRQAWRSQFGAARTTSRGTRSATAVWSSI